MMPVRVRESALKGLNDAFAVALIGGILTGVTGLVLLGLIPDLIIRLGPAGSVPVFGIGLLLLVADEADGISESLVSVLLMFGFHLPGAVALAAADRVLVLSVLSPTEPGVVWLVAVPVATLSTTVSLVAVRSIPRRFRLTREGVVTVGYLRGDSEPLPYDNIEVVVRSQTITHPRIETATYELVCRNEHNLTMTAVTNPEAIERVFETVLTSPERQYKSATSNPSDYYFWLLWPDGCEPPEEPVVDIDTLKQRVGAPVGDIDFDYLETAVADDDFTDLGDVGDVHVAETFDGDADIGVDTDVDTGGFDGDDIW